MLVNTNLKTKTNGLNLTARQQLPTLASMSRVKNSALGGTVSLILSIRGRIVKTYEILQDFSEPIT